MGYQKVDLVDLSQLPASVRDFAAYKTVVAGNSTRTVNEYLLDLRTFFRFLRARQLGLDPAGADPEALDIRTFGLEEIRDIGVEQIYEFLLYVGQSRENEWSAKARKLSALRAYFRYMTVKRNLLQTNPTANIESPKRHSTLPKHLSLDESLELLDSVKNDETSKTSVRDYAIITLFLNCGMRLSELVGIDLRDLDRELRSVRVTGKGAKERIVYLNDACRDALREYLKARLTPEELHADSQALFLSSRHHRISNKTVQWLVYKYLGEAGLDNKGYSVHKLRHTAATLMYQTGDVDVRVLKDILGHAQLNTTQIYTHVSDANMENAVAHNPLAGVKAPKRRHTEKKKDDSGASTEEKEEN